jgi:hypothetical protein
VYHRALLHEGRAVEICYEAVWNPDSALAPELDRLTRSLVDTTKS